MRWRRPRTRWPCTRRGPARRACPSPSASRGGRHVHHPPRHLRQRRLVVPGRRRRRPRQPEPRVVGTWPARPRRARHGPRLVPRVAQPRLRVERLLQPGRCHHELARDRRAAGDARPRAGGAEGDGDRAEHVGVGHVLAEPGWVRLEWPPEPRWLYPLRDRRGVRRAGRGACRAPRRTAATSRLYPSRRPRSRASARATSPGNSPGRLRLSLHTQRPSAMGTQ